MFLSWGGDWIVLVWFGFRGIVSCGWYWFVCFVGLLVILLFVWWYWLAVLGSIVFCFVVDVGCLLGGFVDCSEVSWVVVCRWLQVY